MKKQTMHPRDRVYPGPPAVFVFGSNLAGIHGAGAAKYAYDNLGAWWSEGSGRTSEHSYAIPTKDAALATMSLVRIAIYVDKFREYAAHRLVRKFFVTRIGCGLAGYDDKDIAPLFRDMPYNVTLPIGWENPGLWC